MKMNAPKRVFAVACVFLAVGQANAAFQGLCSSTALTGSDTCVCPTGVGKSAVADAATTSTPASAAAGVTLTCFSAIPCGITITAGGGGNAVTGTIKDCDSLIQGYALAVGASSSTSATLGSTAVICPAGYYCAGSLTVVLNGLPASANAVVRGTSDGATACVGQTSLGGTSAISAAQCVGLNVCGQNSPTSFFGAGVAAATNDVLYSATTSAGSSYQCTCPPGTGRSSGASGSTLPAALASLSTPFTLASSITYSVTAGSGASLSIVTLTGATGIAADNTLKAAYIPQFCTDLLPGYDFVAVDIDVPDAVNACSAGQYCPGTPGLFGGALVSGSGITGSGVAAGLVVAAASDFASISNVDAPGTSGTAVGTPCPTGTTNGGANTQTTSSSCTRLAAGYYIPATAAANVAPSPCAAGYYCAGSTTPVPALAGTTNAASSKIFGATLCTAGSTNGGGALNTAIGSCTDLAPGYYLPAATGTAAPSSSCSSSTACSVPTVCLANYYCTGLANVLAVAGSNGNVLASVATPTNAVGSVVCATAGIGSGGATAVSAATGCSSITPGYYLSAGSVTPASCSSSIAVAGTYCPGFSSGYTGVTISANTITNTATTASGVVSCPTGVTGTATGQSSISLACTNLAAGYALVPGVTTATVSLSSLIYACPTGATCAGVSTFFGTLGDGNYAATGVVGGLDANMLLVNATSITTAVATAIQTGTAFALVNAGYFIAPSSYTPVACPAGSFCAGGDRVGDSTSMVIPIPCPAGTTFVSAIGCALNANFYAPTANTVLACAANYYCPGSSYLGFAGGGFLCPASNSTIEACNTYLDNVQSSSYAAGASTTNVAAAAPAVTVSPAAVTVTPAPITVTPAPITVTTAPVSVTPASQPITINVPAPVSAASTRSSALVLVLAALAALAAF